MGSPAPSMLFLFAFVIRHALCQKQCKSVGQSTRSINMLVLQGHNPVQPPGNHHRISVALHIPLLHH